MNARSLGTATSNQRPVISGTLSAIPFSESVLSVDTILSAVMDSYVNKVHTQIVKKMMEDDEWRELIPYLKVSSDDLELIVNVNHPLANDLEYGTPDRPMKPLIRTFMQSIADDMSKSVERATKKELG